MSAVAGNRGSDTRSVPSAAARYEPPSVSLLDRDAIRSLADAMRSLPERHRWFYRLCRRRVVRTRVTLALAALESAYRNCERGDIGDAKRNMVRTACGAADIRLRQEFEWALPGRRH